MLNSPLTGWGKRAARVWITVFVAFVIGSAIQKWAHTSISVAGTLGYLVAMLLVFPLHTPPSYKFTYRFLLAYLRKAFSWAGAVYLFIDLIVFTMS